MNALLIIILIIVLIIIVYFINQRFTQKEHFISLLKVFNGLLEPENIYHSNNQIKNLEKKDLKNNQQEGQNNNERINENNDINNNDNNEQQNIQHIFKKCIFLRWNKEDIQKGTFYFYDYLYHLYLKETYSRNQINLWNMDDEKVAQLRNHKYHIYTFDVSKLYHKEKELLYHFSFQKDYNDLKIYPDNQNFTLHIKKYEHDIMNTTINTELNQNYQHILWDLYLFEKKIGSIYKRNNYYKIEVENAYQKYLNIFGIGLSLIIKMN